MEDKKDKKIRLLSDEVDRLRKENEAMRKENAELQGKVNEMSNPHNEATIAYFQSYEQELQDQIDKAKKLCSLYQKATNKAITEFNKSLSQPGKDMI